MRRTAVVVAIFVVILAVVLALVTFCGGGSTESVDRDIDSGKVVERSRRVVVVLEDDGERDRHSISKNSRKCPVGSRWPDCKR